jgi:fucose 4-O-acetylase-like acetyltransferase
MVRMTSQLEVRSAQGARRTPPAKTRDPLLDNAKFLAILLVIVGHAWSPLRDNLHVVDAAYTLVYLFHIPVFVLLAGMVSKSFRWSVPSLTRLVVAVVVPYLIFETAYEAFTAWSLTEPLRLNPLAPSWVMWFLAALFFWRLTVPIWLRLPTPIALGAAIVVSLLAGNSSEDDLALAKTMSLLPFFVLGLHLRREHLERIRTRAARALGAAVLGAVGLGCLVWADDFDIGWIRWRYAYGEIGAEVLPGAGVRLGVIAIAAVLTFAMLALVPGRGAWFSRWGANTMYAYLLHGFFIQAADAAGLFKADWAVTIAGSIVISVVALAIGCLLLSPVVRRLFAWLVEPTWIAQAITHGSPEASRTSPSSNT